ncbi:MAG: metallophosphoesterase [Gemmatimonadaceae bacterium]
MPTNTTNPSFAHPVIATHDSARTDAAHMGGVSRRGIRKLKRFGSAMVAAAGACITLPAQTPILVPTGISCTSRPTGGNADDPHPVCQASAVVTHGPYLHAPTDSSATITWITDVPSSARVLFGINGHLDRVAFATQHGMMSVGTLHSVRLSGLKPGQTYDYRVANMPVFELTGYWPKTGIEQQSAIFPFTTFDPRKASVRFASITDTHENLARIDTLMQHLKNDSLDFLVQTGDAFNDVRSEAQVFDKWLSPLIDGKLHHSMPLILARGNHDVRGPFAREFVKYVPVEEDRYYFARDAGPVHLLVMDSGEDKPDSTQVYASLNRFEAFRNEELTWFKRHTATNARAKAAPFRIVVMHQASWGWDWRSAASDASRNEWIKAANAAGVDLVIAGHNHTFSFAPAGTLGANYPMLVVGTDQVAKVQVTAKEIRVQVVGKDGGEVKAFTVPVKGRR